MSLEHPVARSFFPRYNLDSILRIMCKAPFEPLNSCSLQYLTLKTVFLVALAAGRRRSEIHVLSIERGCFQVLDNYMGVHLLTEPGFLESVTVGTKIFINDLANLNGVSYGSTSYMLSGSSSFTVRSFHTFVERRSQKAFHFL